MRESLHTHTHKPHLPMQQIPEVVEESKKRFSAYVAGDHSVIHPDLLAPVFTVALASGDDKVFDDLIKLYDEATVRVSVCVCRWVGGCACACALW